MLKLVVKSHINILDIKKLNRKTIKRNENKEKVEYRPTGIILITFEGIMLHRYVSIYSLEFWTIYIIANLLTLVQDHPFLIRLQVLSVEEHFYVCNFLFCEVHIDRCHNIKY